MAKTSPTPSVGSRATLRKACNESPGITPPAGVAAARSAAQSAELATQAANTLARELNVDSVDVSPPLGEVSSTDPTAPVTGSARFAAMDAPLGTPGTGPTTAPSSRNWAVA